LEVPPAAGSDAVALRISSRWGEYLVLSDFTEEAEVDGVLFAGRFGVLCRTPEGSEWLFSAGTSTLKQDDFGFSRRTGWWSGDAVSTTRTLIRTATEKPNDWPSIPEGCQTYVLADDGQYNTGFPVQELAQQTITVRRFPLPRLKSYRLPAVRYLNRDAH
jgi:hypothetical protein